MNGRLANTWITQAYRGGAKLWKVFWIGYMPTVIPVVVATRLAKEFIARQLGLVMPVAVLVAIGFFYAWLAISMWRCSENTSHKAFTIMGRIWSLILWLMLLSALMEGRELAHSLQQPH